jgi:hypothetical protein
MTRLTITPELRGDLGELYFKHLCKQRGYAFTRLEDIYVTFTPQDVLEFKFGFDRVLIQIPEVYVDEVRRICKPTDIDGSSSFVFDFLTCKLGREYAINDEPNIRDVGAFSWVEVKSGHSQLSRHQEETARKCKIKFNVFRVKDVMDSPDNVWISWDGQGIS